MYILQLKEERDDADAESVLLSETLTSLEVEEKQRKSERDVLKARLDKIVQEAKEALKVRGSFVRPQNAARRAVRALHRLWWGDARPSLRNIAGTATVDDFARPALVTRRRT